eukprot:4918924-Prymnesium_polylepis.1
MQSGATGKRPAGIRTHGLRTVQSTNITTRLLEIRVRNARRKHIIFAQSDIPVCQPRRSRDDADDD